MKHEMREPLRMMKLQEFSQGGSIHIDLQKKYKFDFREYIIPFVQYESMINMLSQTLNKTEEREEWFYKSRDNQYLAILLTSAIPLLLILLFVTVILIGTGVLRFFNFI